jgi:hypothetical protein
VRDVLEKFGYETVIAGHARRVLHAHGRGGDGPGPRALGLVLAVTRLMDMRLSDGSEARREAESFMQSYYPEVAHG